MLSLTITTDKFKNEHGIADNIRTVLLICPHCNKNTSLTL